MSISARLLPEFDEEFAATRKFLELVPDDKLAWKPHPKSMELGRLAWHLSDFPEWCLAVLKQDALRMTGQDSAAAMERMKGKKRADMLARFDHDLPEARSRLAAASDADLEANWKLEWAGQTVLDNPREDVLRRFVLSHMIHHRAQLGVYLRMNGAPVPGVYGASADEAG
ncbi:MAG: DinB family protein [Acidobacteriota bacterium]